MVLAQSKVDELYGKDLKDIRIKGLRYTQEEIILRELASKVGQPYTETNAQKDFAKLDKLDIFSSIEIQPFEKGNDVVLEIRVKELFPYLPFFSYEVTDENGFADGPGFQSVNLLGRDRFLFGAARFGETNLNFPRQAGSSVGMAISGHLILTSDDMCQLSKSCIGQYDGRHTFDW